MRGYVVYNEEFGVCIGEMMGMCFWSLLDPVDQDSAVGFVLKEEAEGFITYLRNGMPELKQREFKLVEVDIASDGYVPMQNCVDAGLPGWEVNYYCKDIAWCGKGVNQTAVKVDKKDMFCSPECEANYVARFGHN